MTGPCLDEDAVAALVGQSASAELLKHAAAHLIGTPQAPGCTVCPETIAARFLESRPDDPEVAAARALRERRLQKTPGPLNQLLACEAADAGTLARWEHWAEARRGSCDPGDIPGVILASYALRFDPGAPGLLAHARLAATMADVSGDPWGRAFAHSWLSRVRGIRGELREAAREIDAGMKAVDRLDGTPHRAARAFALHQAGDLRLRLRDFGGARDRFDRAIDLYTRLDPPQADHAQVGLALMYTEAGQWEEAREVLQEVFATSQSELVVVRAFMNLTAEVLPNLAREGGAGSAEQALCFYAVTGRQMASDGALGLRARACWRKGRIAWALGARETAQANLDEARTLFLAPAPDVAGMYEAASITLDMLGALLEEGSLREMQAYALEAANIFSSLGADISALVALGLVRQLETRAGGAGIHALAHARIALELAEKRRLLRAVGEEGLG